MYTRRRTRQARSARGQMPGPYRPPRLASGYCGRLNCFGSRSFQAGSILSISNPDGCEVGRSVEAGVPPASAADNNILFAQKWPKAPKSAHSHTSPTLRRGALMTHRLLLAALALTVVATDSEAGPLRRRAQTAYQPTYQSASQPSAYAPYADTTASGYVTSYYSPAT